MFILHRLETHEIMTEIISRQQNILLERAFNPVLNHILSSIRLEQSVVSYFDISPFNHSNVTRKVLLKYLIFHIHIASSIYISA